MRQNPRPEEELVSLKLEIRVDEVSANILEESYGDREFLVFYHRDFYVTRDSVITELDVKNWFAGGKIPQAKTYHIFPLSAYIHSGIVLKLGTESFPGDEARWDTSVMGVVMVAKAHARLRKSAACSAQRLVDDYNKYLSQDIWEVVISQSDGGTADGDKTAYRSGIVGWDQAKREAMDMLKDW
jgi:hypothetical protein